MRIVSHAGIGSGPGTAKRASAPVTKAVMITEMTLDIAVSLARHAQARAGDALARSRARLELAEQPPGDRGDLVDRRRERSLVRRDGLR